MKELIGPSLDSPVKVDNYIKAWTGGLGNHVLQILDLAFEKAGIAKPIVKPGQILGKETYQICLLLKH